MYTKMQMRGVVLTIVGVLASSMLVRLWAAKHSLDSGASGVLADSVQATF